MGQFSWFTQDTHEKIVNYADNTVYMTDDNGHIWEEDCYEGYGVFGGKDFYELLSEMNGGPDDRNVGIDMAFAGNFHGENPDLKYPNLVTNPEGWVYTPESPKTDPDQGFSSKYR